MVRLSDRMLSRQSLGTICADSYGQTKEESLMHTLDNPDAFIGTTTFADLTSSTGSWGNARLSVRVKHTITGPVTDYVVRKNVKIWHEAKQLSEAIAAFNLCLEKSPGFTKESRKQ
jgi:hypothetical protein